MNGTTRTRGFHFVAHVTSDGAGNGMNIDMVNRAAASAEATIASARSAERAPRPEQVETDAAPPQVLVQQESLRQRVQSAAAQIESYLKSAGRALEFRVDDDTGRVVVTVRDSQTGETIRQIPSEEALALARSLGDGLGAATLVDLSA